MTCEVGWQHASGKLRVAHLSLRLLPRAPHTVMETLCRDSSRSLLLAMFANAHLVSIQLGREAWATRSNR
jgi:hypothetical protein